MWEGTKKGDKGEGRGEREEKEVRRKKRGGGYLQGKRGKVERRTRRSDQGRKIEEDA